MRAPSFSLLGNFWRHDRGAVLVEFVVLLPFLLALLLGVVEIGRGLFYHHYITNGVRDGIRYLARTPMSEDDKSMAKQIALMGLPDDYADPNQVDVSVINVAHGGSLRGPDPLQVVQMTASVPIPFPLLGFFGLDTLVTFVVSDRARHIGE